MKWLLILPALMVAAAALAVRAGLAEPGARDVPEVPRVVSRSFGDITIHALHTGWVRVKRAHRDLEGPVATRLGSIVLDRRWTEWMPITSYAVVHPEGVYLVDTGLTEAMLDPAHVECDPGTALVYGKLLKFRMDPEDRIDRRLASVGVDPSAIRAVVLTHRHADHTEGLGLLPPSAAVHVGAGDWPTHKGALACRWPEGRTPVLVGDDGPPAGAFPHSRALTRDGRVRVVPMRGHSPGHLGLHVALEGGQTALFIGDAAFDIEQIRERRLAGIVEVPGEARLTLDRLAGQLESGTTFLLPAHDPASLERFGRGQPTTP